MDVRKVERAKPPAYPDREASLRDPSLLMNAPERWKRNAAACAALAATSAILLNACKAQSISPLPSPSLVISPSPAPTPSPEPVSYAVPLFEHGIGRGGFGCVSVAPPVFLNEYEAMEIITEVAEAEGLKFSSVAPELKNVGIPATVSDPTGKSMIGTKTGTLLLDGAEKDCKLAFEYISAADMEAWVNTQDGFGGRSYDFIGAARALSGSLAKADTGMAVAVFYDPVQKNEIQRKQPTGTSVIIDEDNYDEFLKNYKSSRKAIAEELLREQVRDFIAWLKAQGII
jgi:hypothetical protein